MLATPQYLFAMKCRAMRVGGVDENADIDDVRRLALELGLATVADAIDLVLDYYPQQTLPPKTRFGLEEIFSRIAAPAPSSPGAPSHGGEQ